MAVGPGGNPQTLLDLGQGHAAANGRFQLCVKSADGIGIDGKRRERAQDQQWGQQPDRGSADSWPAVAVDELMRQSNQEGDDRR